MNVLISASNRKENLLIGYMLSKRQLLLLKNRGFVVARSKLNPPIYDINSYKSVKPILGKLLKPLGNFNYGGLIDDSKHSPKTDAFYQWHRDGKFYKNWGEYVCVAPVDPYVSSKNSIDLVEGSHLFKNRFLKANPNIRSYSLTPGDLLIFNSKVLHRRQPGALDHTRRSFLYLLTSV